MDRQSFFNMSLVAYFNIHMLFTKIRHVCQFALLVSLIKSRIIDKLKRCLRNPTARLL